MNENYEKYMNEYILLMNDFPDEEIEPLNIKRRKAILKAWLENEQQK